MKERTSTCGSFCYRVLTAPPYEERPRRSVRRTENHRSVEGQRCALELLPHGAGWPEVVHAADAIFVSDKESHEPALYFHQLLAYDVASNEVVRKKLEGVL